MNHNLNFWVNGEKLTGIDIKTLSDLIEYLKLDYSHLAIALNNEVIHQSEYQTTQIQTDDWIELISAFTGG